MRVGPWGTLQVFADVFKMLTKEIITIRRSDKFLYNLAPYIVILASVLAFSCLPFNKGMEILDFNVGVFFMMAASSIGIVGILLAVLAIIPAGLNAKGETLYVSDKIDISSIVNIGNIGGLICFAFILFTIYLFATKDSKKK